MKRILFSLILAAFPILAQDPGDPPCCSANSPMHTDCYPASPDYPVCSQCAASYCTDTDRYCGEVCNSYCNNYFPICMNNVTYTSGPASCRVDSVSCPNPNIPYYCVLPYTVTDNCTGQTCRSGTGVPYCCSNPAGACWTGSSIQSQDRVKRLLAKLRHLRG